jgi:hypothetical protein
LAAAPMKRRPAGGAAGAGGPAGQLDRFEVGLTAAMLASLEAVQVSIEGRGLLDSRNLVVCCIRDRDRLTQVFEEHRPQVVFHAAALKHLPLLELPAEVALGGRIEGHEHEARSVSVEPVYDERCGK